MASRTRRGLPKQFGPGRHPAEEARVSEESRAAEAAAVEVDTAVDVHAVPVEGASLDQPEDEATEHALRLMDEALRRTDAGRRWLVAGDP
jgi:hypothetical protein